MLAVLVEKSKQHNVTVRLKGGDVYVFGRGGEEGQVLALNHVDFEVVNYHRIRPMIKSGNFSEIDNTCKSLGKKSSTRITIILPDGRVIGDSDENIAVMKDHSDRPEFRAAINEGFGKAVRFSNTVGKNMMYFAVPIKQDDKVLAVVRTSIPITVIDQELTKLYKRVLWAGIIIAVCAAVVSLFISKKLSRPIEQMKEMAKRFASGDFSGSVPVPSATEPAELANALNEMAQQLSDRIDTITEDKNQIHAILSSMIEGVMAVDAEGRIVSLNRAAADFLGYRAGAGSRAKYRRDCT